MPLLVLGFISHARWRLPLAAVAVAVAFAVAGSKGIVMLEDLWVLPLGIGMTDQLILLLLWCLLGSAARAVGPLTVSESRCGLRRCSWVPGWEKFRQL